MKGIKGIKGMEDIKELPVDIKKLEEWIRESNDTNDTNDFCERSMISYALLELTKEEPNIDSAITTLMVVANHDTLLMQIPSGMNSMLTKMNLEG